MERLEHKDYLALRAGAEVIEADWHGDKVLRLADGSFLKLFRRKRLLSSALWYPYAQRFADNCAALTLRGIACPAVVGVYRIPSIRRDAVLYHPLEGRTVRQTLASGMPAHQAGSLRASINAFILRLHEEGVLFRSLHLGNIVCLHRGGLGLIDVADISFSRRPLSTMARARNRRHLLRYADDAKWLSAPDS